MEPTPTRALTTGLLLAMTLHAVHGLAVVTALPVVADDLDGHALYGAAFSVYLLASLAGLVAAGRSSDRRGLAAPFATGLCCFAVGLTGSALAPTMTAFVAARIVEGLGGGMISAVLYATVNRSYPPREQPRVLAWLSAAWVVPGIAAPPLAGYVAEAFGWRPVFLGLLPFAALCAALVLPPLRRVSPRASAPPRAALAPPASPLPALLRDVLLARRGLPAAIATKTLFAFAFFGPDSFLPLALVEIHGRSPAFAGFVLTIGSLSWTAGAFLQARFSARLSSGWLSATAAALLLTGLALSLGALSAAAPVVLVFLGWTLAGLGMGVGYNTANATAMASTAPGREGATSTALGMADSLGIAAATGLGGALVAAGLRGGAGLGGSLGDLWLLAVTAVFAVALAGARMEASQPGRPAPARRCLQAE